MPQADGQLSSHLSPQCWIAAFKQVASIAGKNPEWMARQLHEWTHDFVHDPTNLPKHEYGKFNSSILEDEDLAQEICLHLQLKGKYVCTIDVVRFLDTPEMKEQLNLKKSISEQTKAHLKPSVRQLKAQMSLDQGRCLLHKAWTSGL